MGESLDMFYAVLAESSLIQTELEESYGDAAEQLIENLRSGEADDGVRSLLGDLIHNNAKIDDTRSAKCGTNEMGEISCVIYHFEGLVYWTSLEEGPEYGYFDSDWDAHSHANGQLSEYGPSLSDND